MAKAKCQAKCQARIKFNRRDAFSAFTGYNKYLRTLSSLSCYYYSMAYPQLNYNQGQKWIKNLTKDRLSTFNGGHYSDVNLSSILFLHRLDAPDYVKLKV